jgi:hypothetical protein
MEQDMVARRERICRLQEQIDRARQQPGETPQPVPG